MDCGHIPLVVYPKELGVYQLYHPHWLRQLRMPGDSKMVGFFS